MIVLARHASQDIEEPEEISSPDEGAEAMLETGARATSAIAVGGSEEIEDTAGIEELKGNLPVSPPKETGVRATGRKEKKVGSASKAAAKVTKRPIFRKKGGTASHKAK